MKSQSLAIADPSIQAEPMAASSVVVSRAAPRRMTLIDGLRGLAALCVVFNHTSGIWSAVPHHGIASRLASNICPFGSYGVDIFFVISGFVIAHSLLGAVVTPAFVGRFALRRSLRLDPPYWCAIVVTLLFMMTISRFGNRVETFPSWSGLLAHLFYLQGLLGIKEVNSVFWTLCLEIQFYLIFIAMLCAVDSLIARKADKEYRNRWTTIIIFTAFALSLTWPLGLWGLRAYSQERFSYAWYFGPDWCKFLIGAIICYAARGRVPPAAAWGGLAAFAIISIVNTVVAVKQAKPPQYDLLVAFVTALTLHIASLKNALYRWLNWQPLLKVGVISYSLYLLHTVVVGTLMAVQLRVPGGRTTFGALIIALAVLAISLMAAAVSYRLVEQPSVKLSAKFKAGSARRIEAPLVSGELTTLS